MRTQLLVHFCLLWSLNAQLTYGAETPAAIPSRTNAPAASLRLFTDKGPLGKINRALFQFGNDRFSFVVPEDFRAVLDPVTQKVGLVSSELQATIIMAVKPTPANADIGATAASLRACALADHAGAQVVDEFEISVGNWRGPAIEIEWPAGSAKRTSLRMAHVPFPSGILTFTLQAPADQVRACDRHFNQLLLSIRGGLNGRPVEFQQFLSEL